MTNDHAGGPPLLEEIEVVYQTKLRRENLLALAEPYKGAITSDTMQGIVGFW